ncbi:MAG TPA: NAD(P)-binding domain-containing protein [Pseudonocardiaceae bacterium]
MTVAVPGLGRTGAPMAAHVVRAGHAVRVWNRGPVGYQRLADELRAMEKCPLGLNRPPRRRAETCALSLDEAPAIVQH